MDRATLDAAFEQAGGQPYLTTAELASLLRTSPETVRYWRHIGSGPKSFKIGRRVLYAAEDVDAYIAEARAASGAA
jgi:excisionase family DNA binding protein